jgi:hypothetical protein
VLFGSLSLLKASQISITRHYVKGHQDKLKKGHELTLPEIYIIDYDASTTLMQYDMHTPANTVVPFPASRVNVYITHQHISSALNSLFHQQFTANKYWQYLEHKFSWTPTTHKLIDWKIYHNMFHKQTTKRHQQLLKYSVEWLPTGYIVHRNDSTEDHRCPHCRTVYEKNSHILRCPHLNRAAQRQRFLTVTLHNFYPHTMIEYQENYYGERERPPTDTGQTWAKKLISLLWTHFIIVWKIRCDKRHELDINRVSQQHTAKVHARVRAA